MNIKNLLYAAFFCFTVLSCSEQVVKQKNQFFKHSHNDYEHDRPLFDALSCKFKSIEADIYLVGDSLFVSHDFEDIKPGRTLQTLYLDPLKEITLRNKGSVYGSEDELILLVDIKNNGLDTYKRLHKILESYQDMLTVYKSETKTKGAVSVIISGDRSLEYMQKQQVRFAAYDGRISDLDSDLDESIMPLVSDNWQQHFTWNGSGEMPDQEKKKLRELVQKAHKKGCLLRFWATNDKEGTERKAVWNELKKANVDLIGTDDLKGLQKQFMDGFKEVQ